MLFANISSDKIQFILDGEETIIDHIDLEKTIASFLHNRKSKIENLKSSKVFIINGPGSFTNLRISTLAFNMYNFLEKNALDFYSIDKLTLYKNLYKKKMIPQIGYIYIGQKKNRWRVNLHTMERTQITDHNSQIIMQWGKDFFVDQTFAEWITTAAEYMIELRREGEELVVKYQWKESKVSLEELGIPPTKSVEANYMMEANVTLLPNHKS